VFGTRSRAKGLMDWWGGQYRDSGGVRGWRKSGGKTSTGGRRRAVKVERVYKVVRIPTTRVRRSKPRVWFT
jgi:hypothetical protein